MNSAGLKQVTISFKTDNEHLVCMKSGKFLDYLSDYKLLKSAGFHIYFQFN